MNKTTGRNVKGLYGTRNIITTGGCTPLIIIGSDVHNICFISVRDSHIFRSVKTRYSHHRRLHSTDADGIRLGVKWVPSEPFCCVPHCPFSAVVRHPLPYVYAAIVPFCCVPPKLSVSESNQCPVSITRRCIRIILNQRPLKSDQVGVVRQLPWPYHVD